MKANIPYRLIISGGGTGGHVFPAISIAEGFKERYPDAHILFVGAQGKMEMIKVPQFGFPIIGLWISGLKRNVSLSNLLFPFKLFWSCIKAERILSHFKPDVVVGTGGYASGPIMLMASRRNIPLLIQEQNTYAGLTNRRMANKAKTICVSYPEMEQYFPKEKIVFTGNPVRKDLANLNEKKTEGLNYFSFRDDVSTLFIMGGSLGARTINESILCGLDKLIAARTQVIWQTGKIYYDEIKKRIANKNIFSIRVYDFIDRMDLAYAIGDVVISRSGALAISELCAGSKATILVPSPNVVENHQEKNARALLKHKAAILVHDADAGNTLIDEALKLLKNTEQRHQLSTNISRLDKPDATQNIVNEIEKLIQCN